MDQRVPYTAWLTERPREWSGCLGGSLQFGVQIRNGIAEVGHFT